MALIEIDGLPNLEMVDLSMANCECHNQVGYVAKRHPEGTSNSAIPPAGLLGSW